jgi:hypothetical protein
MKKILFLVLILRVGIGSSQISNLENIKADDILIKRFVTKFYNSLELTPELNQKQYETGGVVFNLNQFNTCVDKNSIYSKDRISNLTGNYHDRYNIRLLSIDSIKIIQNIAKVYTTVEYEIYEIGSFNNKEDLIIAINNSKCILKKWSDIKVKKMKVNGYGDSQNFKEIDFYNAIGSINKK